MPWEFKKVEEKRKELINAYEAGASMTGLCKEFKISRNTAYKWYRRYLDEGSEDGLKDRSKAPLKPATKFTEKQMQMAIDLKLQKPRRGPKKILAELKRECPTFKWPCPTRLYQLFKEYHLVKSRRLRRRVPATQPLGDVSQCNDVWMADFKGWFLTKDKTKCEPLTITDGYSRYLIECKHLSKKSVEYVWPVFKEAFEEYGLPNRIRTDNGPPFGCLGVGRLTKLSVNIIKAGVIPEWINPGHPEENGRHERFHLTLKEAVANPPAQNIKEQLAIMKAFQEEYNYDRPHEALEMNSPGSYYVSSSRKWDGILRSPEYDTAEILVRKVGQSGCIWLKQEEYFIGQVLTGEYVGLREDESGIKIYYGPVYLGILRVGKGLERPKLTPKKVVRRG